MNLLKETIEQIKENGYLPEDVEWVGSDNYSFSWGEFEKVADVEYDNGFGMQFVAGNLKIVGEDWWLERVEYDGSEGWEFRRLPERPLVHRAPENLLSKSGWQTLGEVNGWKKS